MKEFLNLLVRFRLKRLFVAPTENEIVRMFRYVFVGGFAFVVDYGVFAVANLALGDSDPGIAAATVAGFLAGLGVNYALSKLVVFTKRPAGMTAGTEFAAYGAIGVVGALLSAGLMVLAVRIMHKYVAKVVVSALVLFYNYFARKLVIYRRRGGSGS